MADQQTAARRLELGIERLIIASRWLQAPLYVGLIFVLGVVVVKFPFKLWELVQRSLIVEEGDLILAVLSLVDLILVANLVIMVIISGYENFVSNIDAETTTDRLAWFGKLDAGSLKIKLATSDRGDLLRPPAAALPRRHHHRQQQALCADHHAADVRGVGFVADTHRPAVGRQEG
jgi:hypothetical protein